MAEFAFRGAIAASKSMMNRALIVRSYDEGVRIIGTSSCDDVSLMARALEDFRNGGRSFDCGHAGTVLRFLALRLSRQPGEWILKGSPRLLSRPQSGLFKIFQQLGVTYQVTPTALYIQSAGWRARHLSVEGGESSQFLSSLLLNGWNLESDLEIRLSSHLVSRAYFDMTEKMVRHFGMKLESSPSHWKIPAGQKPQRLSIEIEPDISSCFSVAACAVLAGSCVIENFPRNSWQPDAVFRDLFTAMNVSWAQDGRVLYVRKSETLKPVTVDVNNCPDLVPVLAVLLARASGVSRLTGFSHLVHKESNRLAKVQELLTLLGRRWQLAGSEFLIYGEPQPFMARKTVNPDNDHRMAMAAQVANFGGADLNIADKNVVNKSFPEFWPIVEAL